MGIRWLLVPVAALVFASPAGAQMTASQAVALVKAQHTDAQMQATLASLSPSDRQYVIDYAITPRTMVVTDGSTTTTVPIDSSGALDQTASAGAAPTVSAAPAVVSAPTSTAAPTAGSLVPIAGCGRTPPAARDTATISPPRVTRGPGCGSSPSTRNGSGPAAAARRG